MKRTATQSFANGGVNSPLQTEALPLPYPFAVVAHGAFPAEMHHAQQLQKIFPVAEGDHAQLNESIAPLFMKPYTAMSKKIVLSKCEGERRYCVFS